jgi:hypothetical protein
MSYLRDIIKEYKKIKHDKCKLCKLNKCKQNIDNIIEEKFPDLDLDDIYDSSLYTQVQDLPSPMGTNFCSIFNPLQTVNAIIPDIFRLSFIQNPDQMNNPDDELAFFNAIPKIKYKIPQYIGSYLETYLQKLIPNDLIKSLFYFGFKSNYNKMNFNSINMLEIRLEKIIEKTTINNMTYTDPETIFNELYDSNTLIQAILQFNEKLNKAGLQQSDLTNTGFLDLNYLFTYYCTSYGYTNDDETEYYITSKNIFSNTNNANTDLSYSDMVFINYLKKITTEGDTLQNFLLILENDLLDSEISPEDIEELTVFITFIKDNNIFLIINLALEVRQYILKVISYNLNSKIYNIEKYSEPIYLELSKKIYDNYSQNLKYLYPDY